MENHGWMRLYCIKSKCSFWGKNANKEKRVKTDKEGNPVSMASGFLLMDSVNTKPSIIKNDATEKSEVSLAFFILKD